MRKVKIFVIPFLAYFLSMLTIAILGVKLVETYTGNTAEELWIAWMVILLPWALWKRTKKEEK